MPARLHTLEKMPVDQIELISGRSDWVELLIRCAREAAVRIEMSLSNLDTGISPELRETIAIALRELLFNAVECGEEISIRNVQSP